MNTDFICDFEGAEFLIFSQNVPEFVYYSHIPVFFAALLVALLMIRKKHHDNSRTILFWTIIPFLLWVFFDSIFWASNRGDVIMFVWSSIILIEPMIHAGIFYLQYNLLFGRLLKMRYVFLLSLLFLPLFIFVPTTLTLSSFDLESCLAVEGVVGLYYSYIVEAIFIALITITGIRGYLLLDGEKRKEATHLSIGILFFILTFTAGNLLGSFTSNWQVGQLGLLGMPIFLGFLAYTIVKFQTFKIQVLGSQVLVIAIWFLLLGALFVTEIESYRVITIGTLLLFSVLGYALVQAVRRREEQRIEIESLAKNLEKANERLKILDQMKSEFVSIASHQLRSPLTSIRGYASMLLEGTYGKLPEKSHEAIEKIADSSRFMALSVEDYLNVSRIQSGKMKYEESDFNLKDLAFTLVDDMRREAMRKGLVLKAESNIESKGIVHADIGKTRQVIQNLIDNAMKYTPKGTITLTVRDQKRPKKIFVEVSDTGIGMDPETIETLFDKFERAHNANEVNVTGTGLGLYIARKMAEDMGGAVTAKSDGEGEGSVFSIELPLQM